MQATTTELQLYFRELYFIQGRGKFRFKKEFFFSITLLRQRSLLVKTQVCFSQLFRSTFDFCYLHHYFAPTCVVGQCYCWWCLHGKRSLSDVSSNLFSTLLLRQDLSLNLKPFWSDWLATEPLGSPVSAPVGLGLQIHPQHLTCVSLQGIQTEVLLIAVASKSQPLRHYSVASVSLVRQVLHSFKLSLRQSPLVEWILLEPSEA